VTFQASHSIDSDAISSTRDIPSEVECVEVSIGGQSLGEANPERIRDSRSGSLEPDLEDETRRVICREYSSLLFESIPIIDKVCHVDGGPKRGKEGGSGILPQNRHVRGFLRRSIRRVNEVEEKVPAKRDDGILEAQRGRWERTRRCSEEGWSDNCPNRLSEVERRLSAASC